MPAKELIQNSRPKLFLIFLTAFVPLIFLRFFQSNFYYIFQIEHYIPLYTAVEVLTIFMCWSIFMAGWHNYGHNWVFKDLFLGAGFLALGIIYLFGLLIYQGFPFFITPDSLSRITYLWLSGRALEAGIFLVLAFQYNKPQKIYPPLILAGSLAVVIAILLIVIYHLEFLPEVYFPGKGGSSFRLVMESILIGVRTVTLAAIVFYYRSFRRTFDYCLVAGMLLALGANIAFALNSSAFDIYNLAGHLYRLAAFYYIYKGVYISYVQAPYRQLSLLKEKLARTLASVDSGVMAIDLKGKIVMFNTGMEKITGLKRDQVIHQTIQQCLKKVKVDEDKLCLEHFHYTLKSKKALENVNIKTKQGKNLLLSTSILTDAYGGPYEVVGTVKDLTKIYELEHAYLRAEKLALAGELAAGAAHEIRNPLTSIRGFIQLLQQDLLNSGKGDYYEIMMQEIDRINHLLEQFLQFSRPRPANKQPVNFVTLIKEIQLLLASEAILNDVELEFDLSPQLPTLSLDKEQLKQVLLNVAKNAFEAMPGGGVLSFSAQVSGDLLRLAITDTGIGMDQESLEKLFDPFYTTKENGTGLGMAVSYRIIQSLGGDIRVSSNVGQGTTVEIIFPLAQPLRQVLA